MSKRSNAHKVALLSFNGKRIQKKDCTLKNVVTITSLQFSMLLKKAFCMMAIYCIFVFGMTFIMKPVECFTLSKREAPVPTSAYTNTKKVYYTSLERRIKPKAEAESMDEPEVNLELEADVKSEFEPESRFENISEVDSAPEVESNFSVPSVLYLHVRDVPRDSDFFWVLEVLEEHVSDSDIAVDMTSLVDSSLALNFSEKKILDICKMVHCEAKGESFLGQLAVAEDFVNRVRSPYYGTDVHTILLRYLGELDAQGNYHAYDSEGEVLEERISESVKTAVRLALSGSQMTHRLLKAVTEYVNAEYDLQLGSRHFEYGAMYHYSPARLTEKSQFVTRSFQKIPVSFLLGNHIFYGYWLPDLMVLNIKP